MLYFGTALPFLLPGLGAGKADLKFFYLTGVAVATCMDCLAFSFCKELCLLGDEQQYLLFQGKVQLVQTKYIGTGELLQGCPFTLLWQRSSLKMDGYNL